jgi:hypothetical protein
MCFSVNCDFWMMKFVLLIQVVLWAWWISWNCYVMCLNFIVVVVKSFWWFLLICVEIMNWWVINVETCLNSLHKCLLMFVCWWDLNWCDCCEVWIKMRKLWVLVKNELGDEYVVNWDFDSMFVVVLIVFWCIFFFLIKPFDVCN